jgi:hypothetical protein
MPQLLQCYHPNVNANVDKQSENPHTTDVDSTHKHVSGVKPTPANTAHQFTHQRLSSLVPPSMPIAASHFHTVSFNYFSTKYNKPILLKAAFAARNQVASLESVGARSL